MRIWNFLLALLLLTTGAQAAETGAADSILRMPHTGTRPIYGSIDLSKSNAVGSSILPKANGGAGAGALTDGQIPIGQSSDGGFTWSAPTAGSTALTVTLGTHTIAIDTASPAAAAISSTAIDWATLLKKGGIYTKTLGANTTFTFSNVATGCIAVRLTNTASNYTVTWPAAVYWPSASTPTMTVGAKSDLYAFCTDDAGTHVMGIVPGQNYNF